jgi:hypothetical protein
LPKSLDSDYQNPALPVDFFQPRAQRLKWLRLLLLLLLLLLFLV